MQSLVKHAVLDIGSNSCRLVIYAADLLVPRPLLSEKVFCRLGQLSEQGFLKRDSCLNAKRAMRYFRFLLSTHQVSEVRAIATAGLRRAINGMEFSQTLSNILGHPIKIIDGLEEANLAALGVIHYNAHADGVITDLGGGSIELIECHQKIIRQSASLPIGILEIKRLYQEGSAHYASDMFTRILGSKSGDFFDNLLHKQNLYVVGGSFRAIMKAFLHHRNYCLPVLHHYQASSDEMLSFCDLLMSKKGKVVLNYLAGRDLISDKRLQALPSTAILLKELIEISGFKNIIASTVGLREGLHFQLFSEHYPNQSMPHPLLVCAENIAADYSRHPPSGKAIWQWIQPLLPNLDAVSSYVLQATCLISDCGWQFEKLHWQQHVSTMIAALPWYGITHNELAFMMLTIGSYYEKDKNFEFLRMHPCASLLNDRQQNQVKQMALLLRLCYQTFGFQLDHQLENYPLSQDGKILTIHLPRPLLRHKNHYQKRWRELAQSFGWHCQFKFQ